MKLTGPDAIDGLFHLMKPVDPTATYKVVVYNNNIRYGGFRDAEHAVWFINTNQMTDTATMKVIKV